MFGAGCQGKLELGAAGRKVLPVAALMAVEFGTEFTEADFFFFFLLLLLFPFLLHLLLPLLLESLSL